MEPNVLNVAPKNSLEDDHILPYSRGGESTLENHQLLCASCNKSKSNKIEIHKITV